MKPAWNRGRDSDVVLLMERNEETTTGTGTGTEWDDVPVTQRCAYVQDRDSQKWVLIRGASQDLAEAGT